MTDETLDVTAQAHSVAQAAAARAGVTTLEVEDVAELRQVSRLWEDVWGRSDEGVPINSELLRSLVHAGGSVTVAHDRDGSLIGAAALVLAPAASTYSLIAAARGGTAGRGIGYALKLRQRAWALDQGLTSMRWTFDPLVARNARFNLTKLGAAASEYVESFYGPMADEINRGDDSDRLVAHWRLGSARSVAAGEGAAPEPVEPDLAHCVVRATGPDGEPSYATDELGAWCRVPGDVVALRRSDPDSAAAWRSLVREAFTDAFGNGLSATDMTRSGWYRLTSGEAA